MSDRSWFYAAQGQQQGPFPEAQFRNLIARNTVTADTLVWTDGMSGWQRCGDIPGLMSGQVRPAADAAVTRPAAGRRRPICCRGPIWRGGAICRRSLRRRRRAAVVRARIVGIPRPEPALCHRHIAGRSRAVACDRLLSLGGVSRAGPGSAEPRLQRPADGHLVRVRRHRAARLYRHVRRHHPSDRHCRADLFVLDDPALDRQPSQLERPAACRSPSTAAS